MTTSQSRQRWCLAPVLAFSGSLAFVAPRWLGSNHDIRSHAPARTQHLAASTSSTKASVGSGYMPAATALMGMSAAAFAASAASRRRTRSQAARVSRKGLIGNQAPEFSVKAVVDQEFLDVKLSDYRGKYVVLFFYPLDFTFVCPTEIIAFSDRVEEFREIGAEVLGVSVDSEFAHLAWIQMSRDEGGLGDIEFPLMSDLKKEMATAYDVLSPDGAAYRGLFIIDKEGVVQHSTINSMPFGRSIDETLRVLKAIKLTQDNPDEVCPAGWQPGDETMKPTADGVKEYMSKRT